MFEKEAEEYLKKDGTKAEQILDVLNEISPIKITLKQLPFVFAMLKQIFQDGAEFGYNKANEWHYVKDGDYPKDTKTVLALCIVGGEPYPYLAQYWKGSTIAKKNGVDLNWNCWLNNMQREVVEPYAWKEIVLPELKEIE